jgi:hypothetical protein
MMISRWDRLLQSLGWQLWGRWTFRREMRVRIIAQQEADLAVRHHEIHNPIHWGKR